MGPWATELWQQRQWLRSVWRRSVARFLLHFKGGSPWQGFLAPISLAGSFVVLKQWLHLILAWEEHAALFLSPHLSRSLMQLPERPSKPIHGGFVLSPFQLVLVFKTQIHFPSAQPRRWSRDPSAGAEKCDCERDLWSLGRSWAVFWVCACFFPSTNWNAKACHTVNSRASTRQDKWDSHVQQPNYM